MPGVKGELFGELVVRAKVITVEQLNECLRIQEEMRRNGITPPKLGELLVERGYLSKVQLKSFLDSIGIAEKARFGELAVSLHLVTPEQLDGCLHMQQFLRRMEDQVPFKEEYLSVYERLLKQTKVSGAIPRIGEILVAMGFLKPHQIEMILEQQRKVIAQCKVCSALLNITKFGPGQKIKCGQCGMILEVASVAGGGFDTAIVEEKGHEEVIERKLGDKATFGDYGVVQKLGQDGTGILYRAHQVSKNRDVVLKIFNKAVMSDRKFAGKLLEDVRKVSEFDHPNIKKVYSIGEAAGYHYLAMEYVEGESVHNILTREGRIPRKRAIEIGVRAAEALQYSHERGVIHGDIRPSNIIILKNGEMKIAGLGLVSKTVENVLFLAKSSSTLVPLYIAPEQVMEGGQVDARTDIYSLGATLYHMITGRPPYEGRSPFEILGRFTEESRCPMNFYDSSIPEVLSRTIDRMLEVEPADRYQSMHEVLLDLRRLEMADQMGELLPELAKVAGKESSPVADTLEPSTQPPDLKEQVSSPVRIAVAVFLSAVAIALVAFQVIHHVWISSPARKALEQQKRAMENFRRDYARAIESLNEFRMKWSHVDSHRTWAEAKLAEVNDILKYEARAEFDAFKMKADEAVHDKRFGDAIKIWDDFPPQFLVDDLRQLVSTEKDLIKQSAEEAFKKIEEVSQVDIEAGDFEKAKERYEEAARSFGIVEYVERAREAIERIAELQRKASLPVTVPDEAENERIEHESKLRQAELSLAKMKKVAREAIGVLVLDDAIQKLESEISGLYGPTVEEAGKLLESLKCVGELKGAVVDKINSLRWDPLAKDRLTVKLDKQVWWITSADENGIYIDNATEPIPWGTLSPQELNGVIVHFMEATNGEHWYALACVCMEKAKIAEERGESELSERYLLYAESHFKKARQLGRIVDEEMNELVRMCEAKARTRLDEVKAQFLAGKHMECLDILLNFGELYTKTTCYLEKKDEISSMIKACLVKLALQKQPDSIVKLVSFTDPSDETFFSFRNVSGGRWDVVDGALIAEKNAGEAEKDLWRILLFGGTFKAASMESKISVYVGDYYITFDIRGSKISYGDLGVGVFRTVRDIEGKEVELTPNRWYTFHIVKSLDEKKVNFFFQNFLVGSVEFHTKLDVVRIKSESTGRVYYDNLVICEPKP